MMRKTPLAIAMLALAVSFSAHAAIDFEDGSVIAIFGSGNANGDFTTDTRSRSNVKLGLRAHERYSIPGDVPTNTFGNNANGTYKQKAGAPAAFPARARWNFDWSINMNVSGDGASAFSLNSFTYLMGLDTNPGTGTNFYQFDPINVTFADHSFGDNDTANGAGVEPMTAAEYAALIGPAPAEAPLTLVQNSGNYGFFTGLFPFDPTADGVYTIFLEAFTSQGISLARTQIDVIVGAGAVVDPPPANDVPEPGSLALVGLALAGLAVARKRRAS